MTTLAKQNCVIKNNKLDNKKYPVQMLEVAGDLRWMLANFENPDKLKPAMIRNLQSHNVSKYKHACEIEQNQN